MLEHSIEEEIVLRKHSEKWLRQPKDISDLKFVHVTLVWSKAQKSYRNPSRFSILRTSKPVTQYQYCKHCYSDA